MRERERERERDRERETETERKTEKNMQHRVTISLQTGGQRHPTPIYTQTPTTTHKHLDSLFFHFSTWTDRQTNRPMDGLTDKASHRVQS